MLSLDQLDRVRPGDVLRHPQLGVVIIDGDDGSRLTLHRVPSSNSTSTTPITIPHSDPEWRYAPPGSFSDLVAHQPDRIRAMLATEPARVARLLLDEASGPIGRDDVSSSLVHVGAIAAERFDSWWAALEASSETDCIVTVNDNSICLEADATDLSSLPQRRFAHLRDQPPESWTERLRESIEARDIDATRASLHVIGEVIDECAAELTAFAIEQSPDLLRDLLCRTHSEVIHHTAHAANKHPHRSGIASAVYGLPPETRRRISLDLIEVAIGQPETTPAAHWLLSLLDEPFSAATLERATDAVRQWLREQQTADTLKQEQLSGEVALGSMRGVRGRRLWSISIGLARALADRHARGEFGGIAGARLSSNGTVTLSVPENRSTVQDVSDAMRLMCGVASHSLPNRAELSDEQLVSHLPTIASNVSFGWLQVATRALARQPSLRHTDALELWQHLATAAATEGVRRLTPERPATRFRVGADTHIGRVKGQSGQTNQDAYWSAHHRGMTIMVVADGISVSTLGSGDMASRLLVRTAARMWQRDRDTLLDAESSELTGFLESVLLRANDVICGASLQLADGVVGDAIPMGTTAVAAIIRGGIAHAVSVGDSRVYVAGPTGAASLFGDQNLLGAWLKTPTSHMTNPPTASAGALVGYVGRFGITGEPEASRPESRVFHLLPDECIILCTDGLNDYIPGGNAAVAALLTAVCAHCTPAEAAQNLVNAANQGGGGDNVTVLVAGSGAFGPPVEAS